MSLSIGEVVLFLLLVGLAVYQFQSLRVRELALQAARRACQQQGVQLLDQTVSLQRVSLSRDQKGYWRVWRQYRFDYSYDGVQRRQGHVIMLGKKLQAVVVSEQPRVLH